MAVAIDVANVDGEVDVDVVDITAAADNDDACWSASSASFAAVLKKRCLSSSSTPDFK